jgi:hypothetical protein
MDLQVEPDALEGHFIPHETLVRLGKGDAKAGRRRLRLLIGAEISGPKDGPTAKPATVRTANVADEQGILALLRIDILENENSSRLAAIDESRLLAFVQHATRDLQAVIGVIDGDGTGDAAGGIVGLVYLTQAQFFWSERWLVQERVMTVHPAHRRSRHAIDLLKFACWFVDDMTARIGARVLLTSTVSTPEEALAKEVLFARHLNRIGSHYLYPSITAL